MFQCTRNVVQQSRLYSKINYSGCVPIYQKCHLAIKVVQLRLTTPGAFQCTRNVVQQSRLYSKVRMCSNVLEMSSSNLGCIVSINNTGVFQYSRNVVQKNQGCIVRLNTPGVFQCTRNVVQQSSLYSKVNYSGCAPIFQKCRVHRLFTFTLFRRMSSVFNHLLVLLCCADILVTLTGLIFSFKVTLNLNCF